MWSWLKAGQPGLRTLETDTDFDVVLCDLMMPMVDGSQIYEKIAEVAPPLLERVIFCTGGAFTPKAKRFTADLTGPVLQKPVEPRLLLSVIEQVSSRSARTKPDEVGKKS